jgi:hypothetical protein
VVPVVEAGEIENQPGDQAVVRIRLLGAFASMVQATTSAPAPGRTPTARTSTRPTAEDVEEDAIDEELRRRSQSDVASTTSGRCCRAARSYSGAFPHMDGRRRDPRSPLPHPVDGCRRCTPHEHGAAPQTMERHHRGPSLWLDAREVRRPTANMCAA